MMKITIHAAQRFLERVMNKSDYTCFDVDFALRFLEKTFSNVIVTSYAKPFVVPGFENYKAIHKENTIITIVLKGNKYISVK